MKSLNIVNTSLINNELTMSSRDLHQLIFNSTGKFPNLGEFHKKVRKVLVNHKDAVMASASLLSNGQIHQYNINAR